MWQSHRWHLVVGVLAALLIEQGAAACECGTPSDVHTAWETADAVFQARVESVQDRLGLGRRTWYWIKGWFSERPIPLDSAERLGCCGLEASLVVMRSWKGTTENVVSVLTGRGNGDCGFRFQPEVEYVIFARRLASGDLTTDICTRTKPALEARHELEVLNGG